MFSLFEFIFIASCLQSEVIPSVFLSSSRPDLLDAALLRPGRLDRLLFCDFPSSHDRLDILRVLSRKVGLFTNYVFLRFKLGSCFKSDITFNTYFLYYNLLVLSYCFFWFELNKCYLYNVLGCYMQIFCL